MKIIKATFWALLYLTLFSLSGCGGGGGGDDEGETSSAVSTNYPYLLATPKVTFTPNAMSPGYFDVTVTMEATGPAPIYSIGVWIKSKTDDSEFDHLDLQHVEGNTWSATTYEYVPLPAGDYYLDSIMIEDGDSLAGGLVRSGWYMINISTSHYFVDQRLTNWDFENLAIVEHNVGLTNIPIVSFTLK